MLAREGGFECSITLTSQHLNRITGNQTIGDKPPAPKNLFYSGDAVRSIWAAGSTMEAARRLQSRPAVAGGLKKLCGRLIRDAGPSACYFEISPPSVNFFFSSSIQAFIRS
jgi:hypothetical protein